jgi:hypothetical protein
MLDAGPDNDDSDPDSQNLETKPAAKEVVGRLESEAICRSDDEDVEEVFQANPQAEPYRLPVPQPLPTLRLPQVQSLSSISLIPECESTN